MTKDQFDISRERTKVFAFGYESHTDDGTIDGLIEMHVRNGEEDAVQFRVQRSIVYDRQRHGPIVVFEMELVRLDQEVCR